MSNCWVIECCSEERFPPSIGKNIHEESDYDNDWSLAVVPSINFVDIDEWIINTDTTYNVCPHKDWFTSLEKLDSSSVVMGNYYVRRIAGIATVKKQMHDGVVRDLSDIRYVSSIKKYMLSTGTLEAKGSKIHIQNGVLKIVKGDMIVM